MSHVFSNFYNSTTSLMSKNKWWMNNVSSNSTCFKIMKI